MVLLYLTTEIEITLLWCLSSCQQKTLKKKPHQNHFLKNLSPTKWNSFCIFKTIYYETKYLELCS